MSLGCSNSSDSDGEGKTLVPTLPGSTRVTTEPGKGLVTEEPKILFDGKTGITTPLQWKFGDTVVDFRIEAHLYGGEKTHVFLKVGDVEQENFGCLVDKERGGRVELMLRRTPRTSVEEAVHVICIMDNGTKTTGTVWYVDRFLPKSSSDPIGKYNISMLESYEKEGTYYQPVEKRPASLKLSSLSVNGGNGCGIRLDGSVVCWGESPRDLSPSEEERFIKFEVGSGRTCGIRPDGTIGCRGNGANFGKKMTDPPKGTFTDIRLGLWASCAIDREKFAWCWPTADTRKAEIKNSDKSLYKKSEYKVLDAEVEIKKKCLIRDDGKIVCSGLEYRPDRTDLQTNPTEKFAQLAYGVNSECALHVDSTVKCWGVNKTETSLKPPAGRFSQVAIGENFACAIGKDDHKIVCWGENDKEQLNAPDGPFVQLSLDENYGCAVRPDNSAVCWGDKQKDGRPSRHTTLPFY